MSLPVPLAQMLSSADASQRAQAVHLIQASGRPAWIQAATASLQIGPAPHVPHAMPVGAPLDTWLELAAMPGAPRFPGVDQVVLPGRGERIDLAGLVAFPDLRRVLVLGAHVVAWSGTPDLDELELQSVSVHAPLTRSVRSVRVGRCPGADLAWLGAAQVERLWVEGCTATSLRGMPPVDELVLAEDERRHTEGLRARRLICWRTRALEPTWRPLRGRAPDQPETLFQRLATPSLVDELEDSRGRDWVRHPHQPLVVAASLGAWMARDPATRRDTWAAMLELLQEHGAGPWLMVGAVALLPAAEQRVALSMTVASPVFPLLHGFGARALPALDWLAAQGSLAAVEQCNRLRAA